MTVEDLVLKLSQAFSREIDNAGKQGLSMKEASIAQVLVAKIILADPANKDNLHIKIDFLPPNSQN